MQTDLNDKEVRVLGSLMEKSLTTPDYYPMTLNALTLACNQKTSREPVVSYDEREVAQAIEGLRQRGLAAIVHAAGSRVPKYQHRMFEPPEALRVAEAAVLTVLMLRGPQTLGELRDRTERMVTMLSSDLEDMIQNLATRDIPLVVKLPMQPGWKESRFAHLMSGQPIIPEPRSSISVEPAMQSVRDENARLQRLEEEVAALKQNLAELMAQFAEFKRQFE